MRATGLLTGFAFTLMGVATATGQGIGQPEDSTRTANVASPADPNQPAFLAAHCKNPPAPAARAGAAPAAPAAGGGGRPGGGGPPAPPMYQNVASAEIPSVIAAGQHWRVLLADKGGTADGIVAFDDGSVWLAQPTKSNVVRIDQYSKASVIYTDTYTGGALAANSKGQVFVAERALGNAIWILKPQRKLFANSFNGEPLDCIPGNRNINDLEADSKGGVYMTVTMGGVYYANPKGVVMGRFGTIPGNGIILSPDEKTLYVTGRLASAGPGNNGGLVAYDVQRDGSLTHERQFAETCGDGSAIDAAGRIYCTQGRMPDPADPTKMITGIGVVSPQGKLLGVIPQPLPLQSVAFGGPGKKTLFAATTTRDIQILSIQMITQGDKKRPK